MPRIGMEDREQDADEHEDGDRNRDIDHQRSMSATMFAPVLKPPPATSVCRICAAKLMTTIARIGEKSMPLNVGRMRRKGARIGSTMMRNQRTTGCHGLSPSHDTAMRAMISTVNATSTKPMTL